MLTDFSRKARRVKGNVEKYGTARQAADGYIIRRKRFARWTNEAAHTHTLRICNTYCLSKTKVVKRTRFNVTFIRILSFLSNVKAEVHAII